MRDELTNLGLKLRSQLVGLPPGSGCRVDGSIHCHGKRFVFSQPCIKKKDIWPEKMSPSNQNLWILRAPSISRCPASNGCRDSISECCRLDHLGRVAPPEN